MSIKQRDSSGSKQARTAAADSAGGKHADNLRRINAAGVPGSAGGAAGDVAAADRLEARTDEPRNGYRGKAGGGDADEPEDR